LKNFGESRDNIFESVYRRLYDFFAIAFIVGCGKDDSSSGPRYLSYVDEEGNTIQLEYKSGSFTDSRDGHKYNTVTVGDYTWMAENMAYGGGNDTNESKYGTLYRYSEALTKWKWW